MPDSSTISDRPSPARSGRRKPSRLPLYQKWAGLLILLILATLVATALFHLVRERLSPAPPPPQPPLPVQVETLAPSDFQVTYRWHGSVEVDERALIAARVTSALLELPHREGDRVAQGEVLFRLDDTELAGERRRLEAAIDRVQHELAGAKRDLARQEDLRQQNLASQKSLEDARLRADVLDAQLAEALANLDLTGTRLGYTIVRAPFSGHIQQRFTNPGELALAGNPILELVADSGFKAVAGVSQADLMLLSPAAPVSLEVPSLSNTRWPARIDRIYPALQPQTRKATVAALFPEDAAGLKPGMAVVVHADILLMPDAISVPVQAIAGLPGDPHVFVLISDSVHRRNVETGPRSAGRVLIIQGLTAGEQVIVTAHPSLRDGIEVRPQAID